MDKIKPKFMHAYASYSKTSFVKGCSKIYWVEVEGIQTVYGYFPRNFVT